MKEESSQILRKVLIAITIALMAATSGLIIMSTQIKRVNLNYYGTAESVNTVASTVGSFLLENNIYVSENTNVYPSLNTEIKKGMDIVITTDKEYAKLDTQLIKDEHNPMVAVVEEIVEAIPFEEERIDNATINRGTSIVAQEGVEGQKSTKYLVKYAYNREIYRAAISTTILSESQNRVVEVGTKLAPVVSRSSLVTSVGATPIDAGFKQYNIKLPLEQQQYAYNICKRYGIEYELFLAVMYKESGFNPYALGGGNSYGLCQIHISNHANLRNKLGITDFYNPYDNMTAGAYLLSLYFGSARRVVAGNEAIEAYALNSYNMGEGVYYNKCYSQGILHREYSNSIRALRNRLITNGGL